MAFVKRSPSCIPRAETLKLLTCEERARLLLLICGAINKGWKPVLNAGGYRGTATMMDHWLHGTDGQGPDGNPHRANLKEVRRESAGEVQA